MPQGVQVAHGTDGAHGVQQRALQDPQHAVIRPRPPRRLGGFLKVTGRHADGSIKVEAPTMEELEEQMRNDVLPPHLDEDYPW